MKVSYNKLWSLTKKRNIKLNELKQKTGLSYSSFTKLRKNQIVTLPVLMQIAETLECNIGDMVDFLPDDGPLREKPDVTP